MDPSPEDVVTTPFTLPAEEDEVTVDLTATPIRDSDVLSTESAWAPRSPKDASERVTLKDEDLLYINDVLALISAAASRR